MIKRMRFINIIKAISKFTAFQLLNHRHTLLPRAPRNENKAIRTLWKQIKTTFQPHRFHAEAGKNTRISGPPHGRRAIPTQPAPWQRGGKLTFLNDRHSYGLYLANAATPHISQPFNSFNVTFPKNPPPFFLRYIKAGPAAPVRSRVVPEPAAAGQESLNQTSSSDRRRARRHVDM